MTNSDATKVSTPPTADGKFDVGGILLDRPYDMSEADPVGFIGSAEGLTDAEKHDILGGTTARLLDLN